MNQYRCTYCLGEVGFNTDDGRWVHTTDGNRVNPGVTGDYASEAHNRAGTRVNSADVEDTGEDN